MSYVVLCTYQQYRTKQIVKEQLPNLAWNRSGVYPASFSPFKWFNVSETKDSFMTSCTDTRDPSSKKIPVVRYEKIPTTREVGKSRMTSTIKGFLGRALFPFVSIKKEGDRILVKWQDLGYAYSPNVELYTAKVYLSPKSEVISEEFRERW